MVTRPKTYPHIVRNPEILSGEPVVLGTRVPVRVIVQYARIYSHDLTRLQRAFPCIARADIEEALAFYGDHRVEIDGYISENTDDGDT